MPLRSAFATAAELGVSKTVIVAAPLLRCSDRSNKPLVNNDVVRSSHCRSADRIFEQCGCRDTHSGKLGVAGKNTLTDTKRTPGSPLSRGLCRLLPQLVGSYDPGGGVSGMGMPPGSAYQFKS